MRVTCLGSGDAFGSGGRGQTCFYVESNQTRFLIDCGASALSAMKRFGVDPGGIDYVLLTHLHGDHFGGLPFIIRETQIAAARERPLVVAGPAGLEPRVREAMEVFFPGSTTAAQSFRLDFVELPDRPAAHLGPLIVESYPVIHTKGTNPHALRVKSGDKIIAYSGDTEWTDVLVEAARDADFFICEAYTFERKVKNHLDFGTLMSHRSELTCKRLVLTHLSDEMLMRLPDIEVECAEEGRSWEL